MTALSTNESENISLCEALDRILNKGAVVTGDLVISIAEVDLIYLELQAVVTSVETACRIAFEEIDRTAQLHIGLGTAGRGGLSRSGE